MDFDMLSVRGAYKQHLRGRVDSGHVLEGGEGTFAGPDIAVARMARSAIDKAKGVETTLGEISNRTAEISKEGRREPERGNS